MIGFPSNFIPGYFIGGPVQRRSNFLVLNYFNQYGFKYQEVLYIQVNIQVRQTRDRESQNNPLV